MINTILGSKMQMSQAFGERGRVPVTVIKAGPCVVTQVKTLDKDGYLALQIGFGKKKTRLINKPMQGHLRGVSKKNEAPRFLCEVEVDEGSVFKVGDEIKVSDIFSVGDSVSVAGISKGKGFAGVVKRWHFAGGPKTHGQSDRLRAPGSIGQGTSPGRVRKGKKMAGRMGGDRVTVKGLNVVAIDSEKSEIMISGPVPGPVGGFLMVKKVGEKGK